MENFSPEKCKQLLQTIVGTYDKDDIKFELAKVLSVDKSSWLCSVQTVSGLAAITYNNVQLAAETASDGFIVVPKLNSNVIIAITVRNEVYVYMCSDIDSINIFRENTDGSYTSLVIGQKITFNGGNLGGIVEIISLTSKLNSNISQLQAELFKISAALAKVGGTYTPATLSEFNKSDYEDVNIIH